MDRPSLPSAAVTLTAAAGVLHVSAAAAHLDGSLLLSLAFVALAVAQLATVATVRRWPGATAEVVVFANLAAVGAWAVSRTVGLPLVGTGVEPLGIAGLATVALELAAVAVVVLGPRLVAASSKLASAAVVASLAAVAVAAPATGHAHDDAHGHAAVDADHAAAEDVAVVQLGPGDFEGDTDLGEPANADTMKALMTGAVQPIVITSDGRLLGAGAHDPHDTGLADAVEERRRELATTGDDGHPHPAGTVPHDD
ncbi:MAG: hypothetical protein KY457_15260 [Actinobacteria bacterium]|nr:hypothetical protein [Actinomycetota bacterium]